MNRAPQFCRERQFATPQNAGTKSNGSVFFQFSEDQRSVVLRHFFEHGILFSREAPDNFAELLHVLFNLANLLIQDFDYSFLFGKKNLVPSSALVEPFDPLGLCHLRFSFHCVTDGRVPICIVAR
jgi:hypothetical protein